MRISDLKKIIFYGLELDGEEHRFVAAIDEKGKFTLRTTDDPDVLKIINNANLEAEIVDYDLEELRDNNPEVLKRTLDSYAMKNNMEPEKYVKFMEKYFGKPDVKKKEEQVNTEPNFTMPGMDDFSDFERMFFMDADDMDETTVKKEDKQKSNSNAKESTSTKKEQSTQQTREEKEEQVNTEPNFTMPGMNDFSNFERKFFMDADDMDENTAKKEETKNSSNKANTKTETSAKGEEKPKANSNRSGEKEPQNNKKESPKEDLYDSNKKSKLKLGKEAIENLFKKSKRKNTRTTVVLDDQNIKKLVYATGVIAALGISYSLISNSIRNAKIKNSYTYENENTESNTTEFVNNAEEVEDTTETYVITYNNMYDLLNFAQIKPEKRELLSKIWNYLASYNGDGVSNKHISDTSNTKLAHTWDEAVVNYFAYNQVNNDELVRTFDDIQLNIDSLRDSYQNGYKQDVLAYKVITAPTFKDQLINSSEGKDFYNKYESMIIQFNMSRVNNLLVDDNYTKSIVDCFYEEVRKDFYIGQNDMEVEDYKLSVLPIIQAYNEMTKDLGIKSEFKLNKKEKKYIKSLADFSHVEEKIRNIIDTVNYSSSLGLEYTEGDIHYQEIKDLAISELSYNNNYYVSEDARDISDHQEMIFTPIVTEEKEEEKKNDNKNTNNHKKNTNNNTDDAGMIEDDEKEGVKEDFLIEDEQQVEDSDNYQEEDDIPYIEPDTPNVGISMKSNITKNDIVDYIINDMESHPENYQSKANTTYKSLTK